MQFVLLTCRNVKSMALTIKTMFCESKQVENLCEGNMTDFPLISLVSILYVTSRMGLDKIQGLLAIMFFLKTWMEKIEF